MKVIGDLHIHSCLSPCGDLDMTPNNIVGMASLLGVQCIALTDHNSCKNCRATATVAQEHGLGFIAGMEINTREEVHAICLFPNCDNAEAFSDYVALHMPVIKNRADIFGEELVMDESDKIISVEENLLISAADISINELESLVANYGGFCYPAHIDKSSNSVLAVLGGIPDECSFTHCELSRNYKYDPVVECCIKGLGLKVVLSSDAHYLTDMFSGIGTSIGTDPLSILISDAMAKVGDNKSKN